MRTGYLVNVYMDANPYSPTYGQERTERVLDTEQCETSQSANYVNIYSYCEMDEFGEYTGYQINVYEDVEPLSPTYGTQIDERVENSVDCPSDETAPKWEQSGPAYCEQIAYQPSGSLGNSGYLITEYTDTNPLSPSYGTTRQQKSYSAYSCPIPNTNPVYVVSSETCNLVEDQYGEMVNDGTKTVVRVDTNVYSSTYNFGEPETVVIEDHELCPVPSAEPQWEETSYSCEQVNGFNTGRSISIQEDVNPDSETYGTTRSVYIENDSRCPISTAAAWTEISYYCQKTDGFDNGNTVIVQEDKNPNSRTYGQTRELVSTSDPRCVQDTNPSWSEVSYACEQE